MRRVVRLTEFEDNALMLKAAEQDVSVQRLLVESALTFETGETVTDRREALGVILRVERQLAAIGNNLNQIARAVNAGEPIEAGITGSLDYLRSALGKLEAAADVVAAPGTKAVTKAGTKAGGKAGTSAGGGRVGGGRVGGGVG